MAWTRFPAAVLISASSCFLAGPAGAASWAAEVGAYELAYPFPSPDGATLVFQGNFDGRWQLYAIDPATNAPAPGHTFTMLPSGSPWILETYASASATERITRARLVEG